MVKAIITNILKVLLEIDMWISQTEIFLTWQKEIHALQIFNLQSINIINLIPQMLYLKSHMAKHNPPFKWTRKLQLREEELLQQT